MSDTIHVQNIRCYGYTGFLPEEQVLGQWFEVDLTLWVDLSQAGQSDCLEDTVDYRQAIEKVQQLVRSARFALVERLSEAIAEAILTLTGVTQVRVRLTKEAPPIPDFGGQIVIDILRSRPRNERAG
ncbi:dihydroneopterin aldolase [Synechocystis sp. LKSZ1]|uniref:dihydroneopterin aldolase n=1 Tax=Synechocystis sp. LKSZ1 TaxID=3144951 RepID=UPI00336BBE34